MLKELIDKFYSDRQKDRDQNHFYITDAGKCPRAIFFKFKKAPREEIEARVLRMFDHGDYIHQLIMKPLFAVKEIRVVASEINIPPQELISGRADAIISDGKDLYVLDIKSLNSLVFNKMTTAKPENEDQIQLYMHYFKIPKGILLYVDKDQLELKEFLIHYNKERAEELLADLANLKEKIDSDIVPQRIAGYPDDWQCQYCQFREICSLGGQGEMPWDDLKEKIKSQE